MQEEYYNDNEIGGDNIKRPIVVMVIGYIIGIIWGLYLNFSIVLLYILIAFFYGLKKCFKSKKHKKFHILSSYRYIRYIKLILTKQVIFFIIISSIISNTILIFQENQYENLYPEENIMVEGIIISHQEEREYKNRYKLKVLTVNSSDRYQSTQMYIEVKKDIEFEYGDKVLLQGEFRKGSKQRKKEDRPGETGLSLPFLGKQNTLAFSRRPYYDIGREGRQSL